MDNDRYRIFCFVLACARFSLDNLATRSLEHTFHTRLCTSSNGDNNVSCEHVYVYLRVCACICVCIYIYIYAGKYANCSEWMNHRCLGYVLRVHAAWGEKKNKTKKKKKKKKKKNAKNKWTRSVWWLQSCIEINRRMFAFNDFVLVDSACNVSSFFLFFCFFF